MSQEYPGRTPPDGGARIGVHPRLRGANPHIGAAFPIRAEPSYPCFQSALWQPGLPHTDPDPIPCPAASPPPPRSPSPAPSVCSPRSPVSGPGRAPTPAPSPRECPAFPCCGLCAASRGPGPPHPLLFPETSKLRSAEEASGHKALKGALGGLVWGVCAPGAYCAPAPVCGGGGGREGMFLLCTPPAASSAWPSPVPHGGGCGHLASAGGTEGHLRGPPRVVYRPVYRQVVRTEHRKRLRCCPGFYESRGTCVRESGRRARGASLPFLVPPCPLWFVPPQAAGASHLCPG